MLQPDADTRLARSKAFGERVEATVIQRFREIRAAADRDDRYDAVTTGCLSPSGELPFGGICVVSPETPVEIKSVAVVQGEGEQNGRFYLREGQHEALLEAGAVYLFVVSVPYPDRDPLAMKLVPASLVDELVPGWIEPDDRANYAQLAWSRVFRSKEVADGA